MNPVEMATTEELITELMGRMEYCALECCTNDVRGEAEEYTAVKGNSLQLLWAVEYNLKRKLYEESMAEAEDGESEDL